MKPEPPLPVKKAQQNKKKQPVTRKRSVGRLKLSRRHFIKIVGLAGSASLIGTLPTFPAVPTQLALAGAEPEALKARVAAGEPYEVKAATADIDLFASIPDVRNPIFITYSALREVKGLAAGGNYIWAASSNLLARIDIRDNTFQTYGPNVTASYFPNWPVKRPITVDKSGALWLGTRDQGVLRFDTISWVRFQPVILGQTATSVDFINVDPDGNFWFGSSAGLLKLDKSFDLLVYQNAAAGQPQLDYLNSKTLFQLAATTLNAVQLGPGATVTAVVTDEVDNQTAFIWVGLLGLGLRRLKVNKTFNSSLEEYIYTLQGPVEVLDNTTKELYPGGFGGDMTRAASGELWITTTYGAARINNPRATQAGTISFSFRNVFNQPLTGTAQERAKGGVFSFVLDKDHNLWFLSGNNLDNTARNDQGLVVDLPVGPPVLFNKDNGTPNYPAGADFYCGTVDSQGNLWLGTSQGVAKVTLSPPGFVTPTPLVPYSNGFARSLDPNTVNYGEIPGRINAIALGQESGPNRLRWFATDKGLYSFDGKEWQRYGPVSEALVVAVDSTNNKWAGYSEGVYKLAADSDTLSALSQGAPGPLALAVDPDGVTIWAGTVSGLFKSTGNNFTRPGVAGPASSLNTVQINTIAVRRGGISPGVWFGCQDGNIYSYSSGNFAIFGSGNPGHAVTHLAAHPSDNLLWIVYDAYSVERNPPLNIIDLNTTNLVSCLAVDRAGRVWLGLHDLGVRLLDNAGALLDMVTPSGVVDQTGLAIPGGNKLGLAHENVLATIFETNPYNNSPTQEDLVWLGTEHGLSQFAVATPLTNYEPNNDRFLGFPLPDPFGVTDYTKTISARLETGNDIDWYTISIKQRYSRISAKLEVPADADYDLILYPPSRTTSSSSSIFGGLDNTGYHTDIPVTDLGYHTDIPPNTVGGPVAAPVNEIGYHTDIPTLDSSQINERAGIIAFSAGRGNQTEFISALLNGAPGDYQIGVVAYGSQVSTTPYTLTVRVQPRSSSDPPDFSATSGRPYLNPDRQPILTVRAIALTNRARLDSFYGPGTGDQVANSLNRLKTKPGWGDSSIEIIDLNADRIIADAYAVWSGSSLANPEIANQVCEAIRGLIIDRLALYPNLQYVIIAGSDRVVPFYRARETVLTGAEANYPTSANPVWPLNAGDPLHEALRLGYHLTDNIYGAVRDRPWRSTTIFIPELAVGRLVEFPAEIDAQISAYLSNGSVNVSKTLVTGYDFLSDEANTILNRLNLAGITSIETLNNNTWSATALRDLLKNRHELIIFNGHFDHNRLQAANYDQNIAITDKILTSAELNGPEYNFSGSLILSAGCHSGLSLPSATTGDARYNDFAQVLAGRGALFVANTGYAYGDSDEVLYTELLLKLIVDKLTSPGSPRISEVGKALMLAKQQYLAAISSFGFGEYDIKVLNIATLYGLPMAEINLPQVPGASDNGSEVVDAGFHEAPDLKKTVESFDLTGQFILQNKNNSSGSYYSLNNPAAQLEGKPGQPVTPKLSRVVNLKPGYIVHGALLLSATYEQSSGFKPLISNPSSDFLDSANRDYLATDGWSPVDNARLNIQTLISPNGNNPTGLQTGQGADQTSLVILPVQVRNPDKVRLYTKFTYEVYQSPRSNQLGPLVSQVSASQSGGNVVFKATVTPRSFVAPLPHIVQVIVTYSVSGSGQWTSQTMGQADPADPTRTTSVSINGPGIFFIQALDSDGNVTAANNKGLYYTWVNQSTTSLPVVFKTRLQKTGCSSGVTAYRLLMQAIGDELGVGINRLRYSYFDGNNQFSGEVSSAAAEVSFTAANLRNITCSAVDTLERQGPNRVTPQVTTTAGAGPGSLRQALLDIKEGDTIIFLLPAGQNTITLSQPLPPITVNGVTIDATAPECGVINATAIKLVGSATVPNGLTIQGAQGVTIRGLQFNDFSASALKLDGAQNCVIEKNLISSVSVGIAVLNGAKGNLLSHNQVNNFSRANISFSGANNRANRVVGGS